MPRKGKKIWIFIYLTKIIFVAVKWTGYTRMTINENCFQQPKIIWDKSIKRICWRTSDGSTGKFKQVSKWFLLDKIPFTKINLL